MSSLSSSVGRFLRQQQFYLAIAVGIYATFWAIDPNKTNLAVTLVYTLCLCNFTILAHEQLNFLYSNRSLPVLWLIYLVLLFTLTPVMVTIATAIVFLTVDRHGGAFWDYLQSGWKYPFVATIIFGIASQAYISTKCRLERRNRELQHSVEMKIAESELQGQELQRAREIQQGLLPKKISQIAGFEIAGTWEPARIVGGDYFDVIKFSEDRLAICIADVVGKSVSAALLMANVQAAVRAFASESASPSWLCSRVNSVLCENIATGKFVTLFYGVLDATARTFRYTSAGHPRPILINPSGTIQALENRGAVLGVFPAWKYEDSVVHLAPRDRLVLYTDGITEAARPGGEEFGEGRLIQSLKTLVDNPPCELIAGLLREVKKFCDSPLQDDATLIAIAVQGTDGSARENSGETTRT